MGVGDNTGFPHTLTFLWAVLPNVPDVRPAVPCTSGMYSCRTGDIVHPIFVRSHCSFSSSTLLLTEKMLELFFDGYWTSFPKSRYGCRLRATCYAQDKG